MANLNRNYKCQRCSNHGLVQPSKQHKVCPFKNCNCDKCILNDQRKAANKAIKFLGDIMNPSKEPIEKNPFVDIIDDEMDEATEDDLRTQENLPYKKNRDPKCKKCRIHGVSADLKGHRKKCDFRNCPCPGCKHVDHLRSVMAQQVKLRRHIKARTLALMRDRVISQGALVRLYWEQRSCFPTGI